MIHQFWLFKRAKDSRFFDTNIAIYHGFLFFIILHMCRICWILKAKIKAINSINVHTDLSYTWSLEATKFCEISTLLLSYVVPVKSKVEISQKFWAFSEYMNFRKIQNRKWEVLKAVKKNWRNVYTRFLKWTDRIDRSKFSLKILSL